jgi:hypothetical protein
MEVAMGDTLVLKVIDASSEMVRFDVVTMNGVATQGTVILQLKNTLRLADAKQFTLGSTHSWVLN